MKIQEAYELLLSISDPFDGTWARVNRIKEMSVSDRGYPVCLGVLRRRGLCKRVDLGGGLWDEFVLLPGWWTGSSDTNGLQGREDELSKQGR